jgi:hypothetical protein
VLHVRRIVTLFFDLFFPESGPLAKVFEGSRSQYKPKITKKILIQISAYKI